MNEQNPELGRDGNLGFHQVGSSPTGGASTKPAYSRAAQRNTARVTLQLPSPFLIT